MTLKKVELRPAYIWTCDECGRDNFFQGIIKEFSEEEKQDMMERNGIESIATGDFVYIPDEIECPHCKSKFKTLHWSENEDEE